MKLTIATAIAVLLPSCSLYVDGDAITERKSSLPDAAPVIDAAPSVDADRSDCEAALPCSVSDGDLASVCGQLVVTATGEPLRAAAPSGDACGDSDSDGPCAIQLRTFDPLAYVADPDGTPALDAGLVEIDDCGRFRILDVRRPFNGFVGIVADAPGGDYVTTFFAAPVPAGSPVERARVYTITEATNAAWTASAGAPFGAQSFAERGAYVALFTDSGAGVEGVQFLFSGAPVPAQDYYFDPASAQLDLVDPARATTGNAGAALVVDLSLAQTSGQGGERDGCTWRPILGATTAGTIMVAEHILETGSGAPCP